MALYDGTKSLGKNVRNQSGEPENKGEGWSAWLAAKLPMTLFTIDLRTSKTAP